MEFQHMKSFDGESLTGRAENVSDWEPVVGLAATIFGTCLDRMDAGSRKGDFEASLQWGSLAAAFVVRGGTFGNLASIELEQRLLKLSSHLPALVWRPAHRRPKRMMHVLTEAYHLLGHTKLCRKWIELDVGQRVHDVVLLSQGRRVPSNLQQVVQAQGGRLGVLDATKPMLVRAQELRQLAYETADMVALHVHPFDLLPAVAFGVSGGPPIMYVNHADHAFWVGGMVSDVVLDIRDSGHAWTLKHRGIGRACVLPIPLEADVDAAPSKAECDALRQETRKRFGIPEDAVVFLTVGGARKYRPQRGLSFLQVAEAILEACPRSWLVAIGPSLDGEWQLLSRRLESRLLALGNQAGLARFHAMADVYLEGMPAGSLTALLEAGLAGLPCVRAPAQVRPPHASDGSALAAVPQPANTGAYVLQALALAEDGTERRKLGTRLQQAVRQVHCGQAWREELSAVVASLPEAHSIHEDLNSVPLTTVERDYLLEYTYSEDVRAAKAAMFGTLTYEAVRWCASVRRDLESVLPVVIRGSNGPGDLEQKMIQAILPELHRIAESALLVSKKPLLVWQEILKDLMVSAADEGRRGDSLVLAARMVLRKPGLLRDREFITGLVKICPWSTKVGFLKRFRGQ